MIARRWPVIPPSRATARRAFDSLPGETRTITDSRLPCALFVDPQLAPARRRPHADIARTSVSLTSTLFPRAPCRDLRKGPYLLPGKPGAASKFRLAGRRWPALTTVGMTGV